MALNNNHSLTHNILSVYVTILVLYSRFLSLKVFIFYALIPIQLILYSFSYLQLKLANHKRFPICRIRVSSFQMMFDMELWKNSSMLYIEFLLLISCHVISTTCWQECSYSAPFLCCDGCACGGMYICIENDIRSNAIGSYVWL